MGSNHFTTNFLNGPLAEAQALGEMRHGVHLHGLGQKKIMSFIQQLEIFNN